MNDPLIAPDGKSLVDRIVGVRPRLEPSGWRVAAAVAALIAAGPLATIAGAALLEDRARGKIAQLERSPALAAARRAEVSRADLRILLARPGLASTLDGLARALPADATMTRAGRDSDGVLRLEVAAPDPDRLRAALRRIPATAGLRDVGQRRGDGVMLVTLEAAR